MLNVSIIYTTTSVNYIYSDVYFFYSGFVNPGFEGENNLNRNSSSRYRNNSAYHSNLDVYSQVALQKDISLLGIIGTLSSCIMILLVFFCSLISHLTIAATWNVRWLRPLPPRGTERRVCGVIQTPSSTTRLWLSTMRGRHCKTHVLTQPSYHCIKHLLHVQSCTGLTLIPIVN